MSKEEQVHLVMKYISFFFLEKTIILDEFPPSNFKSKTKSFRLQLPSILQFGNSHVPLKIENSHPSVLYSPGNKPLDLIFHQNQKRKASGAFQRRAKSLGPRNPNCENLTLPLLKYVPVVLRKRINRTRIQRQHLVHSHPLT